MSEQRQFHTLVVKCKATCKIHIKINDVILKVKIQYYNDLLSLIIKKRNASILEDCNKRGLGNFKAF